MPTFSSKLRLPAPRMSKLNCACAPIDNKKGCGLSGLAQKGLPRGEKRGFHPLLPSFGGGALRN